MITLIAVGAVIWLTWWIGRDCEDWSMVVFSWVMSTLLVGIFWGFTLAILYATLPLEEVGRDNRYFNISSLRSDNKISGSFFLGSGNIGSSEYYYMFRKNDDGSFERETLSSNDSVIFQNENNDPKVTWQNVFYKVKYSRLLLGFTMTNSARTRYEIRVPENTIIQKYHLE